MYPGCKQVLVLDGNCKNRRDVCGASEAGYIECTGLVGSLKTGCQFSPMRTSKYCFHHAPWFSPMSSLPDPDSLTDASVSSKPSDGGILRLIVNKKTTRTKTYYQVSTVPNLDLLVIIDALYINVQHHVGFNY